jgi:hypothetical protein
MNVNHELRAVFVQNGGLPGYPLEAILGGVLTIVLILYNRERWVHMRTKKRVQNLRNFDE